MKSKRIIKTILATGVLPVLFVLFVAGCENKVIFQPIKYPTGLWDTENMSLPVQDVWFEAKDGVKLHGWHISREKAKATILFFHGNGGNLSGRLENIFLLHHLGLNVFIFDYRGYGRSEGEPNEKGVQLDSQAAYDTVLKQPGVAPQTLFLFGRSLGGVFAAYTASQNPVAGLILESTLTNADDMADKMFPILPVGWFLSAELNALGYVSHLSVPKLFIHGTADSLIPYAMGRKLYIGAAEPKEFYSIVGGRHNNSYGIAGKPYFDKLEEFITQTLASNTKNEPPINTDGHR